MPCATSVIRKACAVSRGLSGGRCRRFRGDPRGSAGVFQSAALSSAISTLDLRKNRLQILLSSSKMKFKTVQKRVYRRKLGRKCAQNDSPNFYSLNRFFCKFLFGQNILQFRVILNRQTRNSTKIDKKTSNFYSLNRSSGKYLFGQKVPPFLANFYSLNRFFCKFLFGQNIFKFRVILNRQTRNSTKVDKNTSNFYSLNRSCGKYFFGQKVSPFLANFYSLNRYVCKFLFGQNMF